MKEIIISLIRESLKEVFTEFNFTDTTENQLSSSIQETKSQNLGDYAFCSFGFCQSLKKNPNQIISSIYSSSYFQKNFRKYFSKIQLVNGYLNFYLDKKEFIQNQLKLLLQENPIRLSIEETIILEYSSPNIAKPLSIAHLRSTIIGQALSNLFEYFNYKVIRINYPGDWGTPFGGIIYSYKYYLKHSKVKKPLSVKLLFRLYVKFNKLKKKYPELNDIARNYFKKLEQGDQKILGIWKKIKNVSLDEFKSIYDKLNVHFDHYYFESDSTDGINNLFDLLEKAKLIQISNNAKIIDLTPWDLNPCIIQKDNQTSLYITRDIISAMRRYERFNFNKMLYITGSEQTLHFKQLFKILDLINPNKYNCEHIPFGLIQIDQRKLSSREGLTLFLKDLIKLMQKICYKKLLEKKTTKTISKLKSKSSQLAISSIIFADLKNNRTHNISFNLKEIINPKGQTGIYLQYTHARMISLIKNFEAQFCPISNLISQNITISEDVSFSLVMKISKFNSILKKSIEKYDPSILAKYTIQLAKEFSRFYQSYPILDKKDEKKSQERILIVLSTQKILSQSLKLLCITPINEI